MRKALEFDTTAWPASAKAGSICWAAVASSAAKTSLGVLLSGAAAETFIAAIFAGIGVARFHLAASAYALPAERSEAASHVISNHGCSLSSWMNLCPTVPVAQ